MGTSVTFDLLDVNVWLAGTRGAPCAALPSQPAIFL